MKTIVCLLLLVSCRFSTDTLVDKDSIGNNATDTKPYVLTLPEAQQILGESGHIKENSDSTKAGVYEYKSSYEANTIDAATNKVGMLYYMYEEYKSEATAKKTYTDIRVGNQRSQGFETLSNLGDEAYFHTDKSNFQFILARKGNKMIRLKVNKVTSKTSVEGLKNVARGILGRV